MRGVRIVAWILVALLARTAWCEPCRALAREVFFLHNRFLAEAGAGAQHPEHGRVEVDEILATLRGAGLVVHAERRPAGADLEAVADRVADQVRARLARGVPASHLTVAGTSEGGYVAMLVARRLRLPDLRVVLVGACVPTAWVAEPGGGLAGRVLRIHEVTDPVTEGCRLGAGPGPVPRAGDAALELRTGLQHGFLYKALDDWLLPTIAWAYGVSDVSAYADHAPRGLGREVDAALARVTDPVFQGVVLVAQGGRTRLARCSGWCDPERTRPLVLRSTFPVGSISKQVTGVLALQAAERRELRLDDPVSAHVPELTATPAGPVTLAQLLSHTHGLKGRAGPVAFAPGTSFAYGNVGYVVAGEVLERATGQGVEALAHAQLERIGLIDARGPGAPTRPTDALGMRVGDAGEARRTVAPGDALPPLAAGGFHFSAPDLVAWTQALHDGRLLEPASRAALLAGRGALDHPAFAADAYGLGLATQATPLGPRIGHTGMTSGTSNVCLHYPARGITVVVLVNLLPRDPGDVARAYAPQVAVVRALEQALRRSLEEPARPESAPRALRPPGTRDPACR